MGWPRKNQGVWVRTEELQRLLQELGASDLWSWVCNRLENGSLSKDEGNDLVVQLLLNYKHQISLQQIANCFGLTRGAVSQIAKELNIPVMRQDNSKRRGEKHLQWLLTDPDGRQLAVKVLSDIARKREFWGFSLILGRRQGHLCKDKVLRALGFPETHNYYACHAYYWMLLRQSGLIQDEFLVGFILQALGEEPVSFFNQYYYGREGATLEDVRTALNRRAEKAGLLRINSNQTLCNYLEHLGLTRKPKGNRSR